MTPVVSRKYTWQNLLAVIEAGLAVVRGWTFLPPFPRRESGCLCSRVFARSSITVFLLLATFFVAFPAVAQNPSTDPQEYAEKKVEGFPPAEEHRADLSDKLPAHSSSGDAVAGNSPPSLSATPDHQPKLSGQEALAELQQWLEEEPEEESPAPTDADSSKDEPKSPGKAQDAPKPISGTSTLYGYLERKNFIRISKTDVNRFVCENGDVTGTIYSEDKGIEVKKAGRNAFLRIRPNSFAFEHPFEFYVTCGDELYTFIVEGDWISASKVVLKDGAGKVEEALDFFRGKTREGNVVDIIKKGWNEKWEDGWREIPRYRAIEQTKDYKVVWYKTVDTGTPWVLELFVVEGIGNPVKLKEEDFLDGDVVAVSCLEPLVAKGRLGKVAVIREKASP
jgi:hypothetical protein